MTDKGQHNQKGLVIKKEAGLPSSDFVLEKSIFSNIFEKDIRRIYIYKKSERLAKAIHLITPAFRHSESLRNRIDAIAIGLIDAAILPPASAKDALSRELLALSSMLSIAQTGGLLSAMNAELIAREAQALLQEVAAYEEPRLFLDEAPTLSGIAKRAQSSHARNQNGKREMPLAKTESPRTQPASPKGRTKDDSNSNRRDAILSIIRSKGQVYIKDISTVIRDVSEKTIQRELGALIKDGTVSKSGQRRWSVYALAR